MSGSVSPRTSALEIAALIRSRRLSAVEITAACLSRIDSVDGFYRACVTVRREEALREARQADERLAQGDAAGPLHGVPVTVKDALLMRGMPTTVGSTLLRDYTPDEDAAVVSRLREAGAIIVAKTNVGSGMAAAPDPTRLEPPRNPWRPDHTPGGSSSGAVVAVALGMAYAGIGTDLGGSIRIPAAFTGVVGLKPTFGLVSQFGDVFGMCRALEHVGPLTRTVRDAALLLDVLAGFDPRDPTSVDKPRETYLGSIDGPAGDVRIGWARDGGPDGGEPDVLQQVERAVRLLAGMPGVRVEDILLPSFDETWWDQFTLLDEWEAYDAGGEEFDTYRTFVRARLRGKRRQWMNRLARQANEVRDAYARLFERFDLLALPTAPIVPKPFAVRSLSWRGRERDTFSLHLVNTWMFNLTGHPAISIPCGPGSSGLPIGLQLVARPFAEARLLRVASALEQGMGGFPLPDVD